MEIKTIDRSCYHCKNKDIELWDTGVVDLDKYLFKMLFKCDGFTEIRYKETPQQRVNGIAGEWLAKSDFISEIIPAPIASLRVRKDFIFAKNPWGDDEDE